MQMAGHYPSAADWWKIASYLLDIYICLICKTMECKQDWNIKFQAEDKELNIMPGRWHVLLKEQGSEDLNGKIAEWIQKRT